MSTTPRLSVAPLPPGDWQHVDAACDRFEAAWKAGQRPRIEDYLRDPAHPALLRELVAVEIDYRRLAAEQPLLSEYRDRFPTLDAAWLAAALAARAAEARRLGKFQLLERVGAGAFGEVWRARDTELDRTVAVKVPHPGLLAAPTALERFQREARAAAQLRHPGIVTVYEVTTLDGVPAIVSDFVDGVPLRDLVQTRRPTFREAATLIAEVAEALDYAHGMGVVHRDVKPANILLAIKSEIRNPKSETNPKDQNAKSQTARPMVSVIGNSDLGFVSDFGFRISNFSARLVDFGLALREEDATLTQEGQVLGTPAYMSPEQAAGKGHTVDRRSDVYSLGVVLYELLCGEPPFRGPRDSILRQVLDSEPRPPRRFNQKIPRDLETVCLKAMAKETGRRYPTARELADDLRRWLNGEPIRSRALGTWEWAWRWARRRPAAAALVLVSGIAMLAVGGAIAGLVYNARLQKEKDRATEAHQIAEAAVTEMEKSQYFRYISKAHGEWRDGNLAQVGPLLELCPRERRGWEWHYLQRLRRLDLLTLSGHTNAVAAVAISPHGTQIASASHDYKVNVWDLGAAREGSTPLLTLTGHTDHVLCVAFSPDGTWLASGSADNLIKFWDLQTGQKAFELEGHPERIFSVKFSPDGTRLASSGRGGVVRVWDLKTRQVLADLKGFRVYAGLVLSVAFSPDGKLLATPHPDKDVKIWRLEPEPKIVDRLVGHSDTVEDVTFSPDGTKLASASWDGSIKVWALDDTTRVRTFRRAHTGTVSSVAFSRDGARLVSGSADGLIKVWDLLAEDVADSLLLTLRGHTSGVKSVVFTPDGTRIISGSSDGTVKIWDSALPQECQTWKGHSRSIGSIAWSPDESQLASTSQDGFIKIWDTATGHVVRRWRGHQQDPLKVGDREDALCVVFSLDGKLLASSDRDGMIKVWDAATWKEIFRAREHTKDVSGLAFSLDGQRLASASDDHTAKIWDVAAGRVIHELTGHRALVCGVAFSPDSKRLATASFDGVVKIWDAATGQEVHELRGHSAAVWSVAFIPDGTKLASASRDTTIRIWDVSPGCAEPVLIFELKGHKDQVCGLAFSPDGSRLASGSADHTVRIWDVATGQEALCLTGHTNWPRSVAFSPSGNRLASGSVDRTIKIWETALRSP